MEYSKRNGFTLVELLIVIGILGFLSVAMAVTFSVVTKTSTLAAGQNMALSQVHLAGSWISRDVQNALKGSVANTTGLCSMTCFVLNGQTFSSENVTVTYTINNGILTRISQVGANSPSVNNVAQYIDSSGTSFTCENVTENKYFKLIVKANYNGSTFEKVYKIKQVLSP